jgi:hypothetical protein
VFVKPNGYSKISINARSDSAAGYTAFDLSGHGSLLYNGANVIGYSVAKLSNGWFRISTTNASHPGAYGYQILVLDPAYTTGNPGPFAGDGTSGMYVWGLQLETGSFPTSYIPTSGATVTRAADVASMTGTNFSSWYRQDEGSFLAKVKALSPTFQQSIFRARAASGSEEMRIQFSGSSALSNLYSDAGASSGATRYTSLSLSSHSTFFAAAYKQLNFAVANATQIVTNTTGGVALSPVFTQADIGGLGGQVLSGTIARLTYYPVRLPDAQLQTITL